MSKIVIIGNSAAGFSCLETLVREAPGNEVTVITKEEYPAYRKDLLLDYLAGNVKDKDIFLCSEDFYKRKNVNFCKNSVVDRLDVKKQAVVLKNKDRVNYDYLIIASGEESNIPDITGKNKDGVLGVYSFTDIERIKEKLIVADTVCVIGKLKFSVRLAEVIASKVKEVNPVRDRTPKVSDGCLWQPISNGVKIITEETGEFTAGIEKTEIITGVFPQELIGEGQLQAVKLNNGKVVGASLALFCGNYIASADFLKGTVIEDKDGYILTDAAMRTNLENVFACGTVAKSRSLPEKEKLWKDSVDEGRLAAENLIKLIEKGELLCQILNRNL